MTADKTIKTKEKHPNGVLCSYPIDSFAIKYYDIKDWEIEPFMDSEYANMHTGQILKLLLARRK